MTMLDNTSNKIIQETFSVYTNEKKEIVLSDSTEGDIRFSFLIEHSVKSQTTINVTSSYTAEVIISTGPFQKTRPAAPIRIGTYQETYDLYLMYEVLPVNSFGKHEVMVSFIIKRP